jgi:hypothetical protein
LDGVDLKDHLDQLDLRVRPEEKELLETMGVKE